MDELLFWCQLPGHDAPCPVCEENDLDECYDCPAYTLRQWADRGEYVTPKDTDTTL